MTTRINVISTPNGEYKLTELTDRQVGIVLAALRHAQEDLPRIEWEEWIESFPNPQDDELDTLCELLNSSVYVVMEET
jgi:hypothetical protein